MRTPSRGNSKRIHNGRTMLVALGQEKVRRFCGSFDPMFLSSAWGNKVRMCHRNAANGIHRGSVRLGTDAYPDTLRAAMKTHFKTHFVAKPMFCSE
jgi:hypothetical protein